MARETHVTNVRVEEGNERPGFGKTGAAWAISLEGKAEDGKEIQISDKAWEEMKLPIAAQAGGEEGAFLNVQPIFGELAKDPAFRRDYLAAFEVIRDRGVRALLEKMA